MGCQALHWWWVDVCVVSLTFTGLLWAVPQGGWQGARCRAMHAPQHVINCSVCDNMVVLHRYAPHLLAEFVIARRVIW